MFTGIVEELGEVVSLERRDDAARLTIRGATEGTSLGESIAVNGVCLTVTDIMDGTFTADVMGETLDRSGLGALTLGAPVNLERSVRLEDRLGGHLVQGHTDGTGTIQSRVSHADWDVVRVSLPADQAKYVVHKGSITVDGVSLTVSAIEDASPGGTTPADLPDHGGHQPPIPPGPPDGNHGGWFEISLIPETLKRTTLGSKQPGDEVNLEVDVIAKYVEKLTGGTR